MAKSTKEEVLDSWEDESDSEISAPTPKAASKPAAPPPEPQPESPPASKNDSSAQDDWRNYGNPYVSGSPSSSATRTDRRPEKTDAVARRMIASALGIKAPKQTEEQKAYNKALLAKEKEKRQQEREAKKKQEEEAAKMRNAIWND